MLKPYYYSAFLLSAIISGNAFADCTTPIYTAAELSAALGGNTICYAGSQEEHHTGGQLWDTKSSTDPTDPTRQIGSWGVINNHPAAAQIVYSYFKGTDLAGPFTFTPHNDGGSNISFCIGSTVAQAATIVAGNGC